MTSPAAAVPVDVVALTADLVRIPSVGLEHGERAICLHLRDVLDRVPGTRTRLVEGLPGRTNLICELDSGRPGPTLLLNGHTDTVAVEPELWSGDPFGGAVADGHVWGRGACDMKGGLAALVSATSSLARRGGPACGRLVLTATADEDAETHWGLPWIMREGLVQADAAIVAEPAGQYEDFEALYLGSLGYGYAIVEVSIAEPGHSSSYGPERAHAVALASRLIDRIESGFRPTPISHELYPAGPVVVAGELFEVPGGRAGDLPRRARFSVGARLLPGAEHGRFAAELAAFVGDGDERSVVRVVEEPLPGGFVDTWAPGGEIDGGHLLAQAATRFLRRRGYAARHTGFPGYSEASVLAAAGIPTLPALGPGQLGRYAHRRDERVSVVALSTATALYGDLFEVFFAAAAVGR